MIFEFGHVALFAAASIGNKFDKSRLLRRRLAKDGTRFAHFLSELQLVLALVAVTGWITDYAPSSVRSAWNALVFASAWLIALEAYYHRKTGSHGDALLLKQIFHHRRDAVLLLRQRGGNGVLALTMLVIVALAIWYAASALTFRIPTGIATDLGTGFAMAAILVSFVPSRACETPLTALRTSAFLSLVRDFFKAQPWMSPDVVKEALELGITNTTKPATMAGQQPTGKHNVLLIVVESARSLRQLPIGTMPFIEALSRQSTTAENFYCVIPHTTAAMVPLLASVYPSLTRPYQIGASLPAVLAAEGYATAFFTPAELQFEGKGTLLREMGFDHLIGAQQLRSAGRPPPHYLGFHDEDVLHEVLQWTGSHSKNGDPFFATFLTLSSHHPYRIPAQETDGARKPSSCEHERYLEALRYSDRCISRLIDGITQLGVRDTTWVVVVGDHGQAFGEHGRRYHSACLWEEVLAVPCIIAPPAGCELPTTIGGVRSQLDLAPTLLEALGLRSPAHFVGQSMFRAPFPDRELFHATWVEKQSLCVRRGRHKYITHYGREPSEYYNVEVDPLEQQNDISKLSLQIRARLEFDCLVWRNRLDLPRA